MIEIKKGVFKVISVFVLAFLFMGLMTGCSLEDLGFEIEYDDTNSSSYSSGTGLNITESKYNRIKNGDSYSKVKGILGGACDNYYSSDDEDWYTCIDDKDFSKRIVLKFINGKLEHKSSSGLN